MRSFVGGKVYIIINALIPPIVFALGYQTKSGFEMLCAISSALFFVSQRSLSSSINKDETSQRTQCKRLSFFMLLPAIMLILAGALIYRGTYPNTTAYTYCAIGLAGVLFTCLTMQLVAIRGKRATAARFLRLTIWAAFSAPMSLIVVLILHTAQVDEVAMLSCLSAVVFASIALLIALNMVMVSSLGYKSTIASMKILKSFIRRNKLAFTRVSILKDAFLVVGKVVLGVISISFFMFVNAMYSAGIGLARFVAIKMHTQARDSQIQSYRLVGAIILSASICYLLYCVRLFFGGKTGVYSMNAGLLIALYTFVEFGINIKDAIRLRKSKALEAKALRAISLSSTLICFVLTQTAIMSFAAQGDNSFANALSGMFFGSLAALVGLYVILDSISHNRQSGS